jgi:hypothetical protein
VKGPYLILHRVGLFLVFVFGRHKAVGLARASVTKMGKPNFIFIVVRLCLAVVITI